MAQYNSFIAPPPRPPLKGDKILSHSGEIKTNIYSEYFNFNPCPSPALAEMLKLTAAAQTQDTEILGDKTSLVNT